MHNSLKRHFKGELSEMQQGIFSLVAVMFVLSLVTSLAALPATEEHDKIQAKLLAMTTASAIDALSITDSGSMSINLREEWNVRITKENVEFSHEDMKISVDILGNVKASDLGVVEKLSVKKEAGKPVEVSESD